MTLRIAAEDAAQEAWSRFVANPKCGDPEGVDQVILFAVIADAVERVARQFAASALVRARCSCGQSEGYYENGLSALTEDEQTEAIRSAERDL